MVLSLCCHSTNGWAPPSSMHMNVFSPTSPPTDYESVQDIFKPPAVSADLWMPQRLTLTPSIWHIWTVKAAKHCTVITCGPNKCHLISTLWLAVKEQFWVLLQRTPTGPKQSPKCKVMRMQSFDDFRHFSTVWCELQSLRDISRRDLCLLFIVMGLVSFRHICCWYL